MATNDELASTLPPEIESLFLASSTRRTLPQGGALFALGSVPNAMFGVVSGRVQVSIFSAEGQRFFAGHLIVGQWFGEVPLLDQQSRAFHVEAVEPAEIAVLPADEFWRLVRKYPDALLAVTRLVCNRYRRALSWIEGATLKPLSARLAGCLLAMYNSEGMKGSLSLSQESLAAQLGVARQTVNRQLKNWERDGVVRVQYAEIELIDRKALANIAAETGKQTA